MRIGIVCHPTFGGSGVMATELANHFGRQGHSVHVISYALPVRLDPFNPSVHYHEVQMQDYPLFLYQPYELALSSAMVDAVVKERLDILHVHYAIPHAYAAFMARQILHDQGIDIPVVTTLHGTDITLVGQLPAFKPAVCFSINHSSAVTAVSQALRRETITSLTFLGTSRSFPILWTLRAIVVGMQPPVHASLRPKPPLFRTYRTFGRSSVSQMSSRFLPKFVAVRPAVLLMVGDGPERPAAEALVRQLGIEEQVNFLGKTTEVERILGISDVFLLPSESESFGLAALEAMASGTPVIASNVGGLPEVISHGVNGFWSPLGRWMPWRSML